MKPRKNKEEQPMDENLAPQERADALMEKKLRLVKEEASIVLSPKTWDLHLLTQLLFMADRAINRMRMEAGTPQMPLRELEAASARIVKFTQKIRSFTGALGGQSFAFGFGFNPREKEILARRKNAYVFMPKSTEGTALANLFISLDAAYCEFKVKSPLHEIAALAEAIDTMHGLVKEFHEITADLTTKTRTIFKKPMGLATYLRNAPGDGGEA
jgi:hypothetical protein